MGKPYWYNVELTRDKADIFNSFLKEKNIEFEPSEVHNLIHFELHLDREQVRLVNEFLTYCINI